MLSVNWVFIPVVLSRWWQMGQGLALVRVSCPFVFLILSTRMFSSEGR